MFEKITLELSLKPFFSFEETDIRKVAAGICQQWQMLLKNRPEISFLLWTADGSELLDYAGDLNAHFPWACWQGTANLPTADRSDRIDRSLHERKRLYRKGAPETISYRDLQTVVRILKEEAHLAFPEAAVTVGSTFDIGPEFAISDFKYRRHREISTGQTLDRCGFVDATALLHADSYRYAAYSDGIPEGTPFGLFLGRQSQVFLRDMGFDALWLSNGLGFSDNPWSMEGKVYDGAQFHPEKLAPTRESVFDFWKQFRTGCPDFPVETRGTNNSVGIDYATDGVPLYDIYHAGLNIAPPPNSPWAALNGDLGLELMGHMTRVCDLPGSRFLYRYYIHDPWWCNSPWYDRYGGEPHDIYLPMAVSRIDEAGNIRNAEMLNILSIDNSWGGMPDCCINEPLPHLLKAEKNAPDAPAPFVWVYPMKAYTTADTPELLEEMYFGDRFIQDAINGGFPLNCVVSAENFMKTPAEVYRESVLIAPVMPDAAVNRRLEALASQGIGVIFYGKACDRLPINCGFAEITSPCSLMKAAEAFGYSIQSKTRAEGIRPPTMTVSRFDNGFWFAVHNSNTTTETALTFPLGAPILLGGEAVLENGAALYRFNRSEYRECRIFVRQKSGVVGANEVNPGTYGIHRRIRITGLEDAEVFLFPEKDCAYRSACCPCEPGADDTPEVDSRWQLIQDAGHGTYLHGVHFTGDYYFRMYFELTE